MLGAACPRAGASLHPPPASTQRKCIRILLQSCIVLKASSGVWTATLLTCTSGSPKHSAIAVLSSVSAATEPNGSGTILAQFWASPVPVLGQFWASSGPVPGQFRASSGPVLGQFWASSRPKMIP
eukprot:gene40549-biopygen21510